MRTIIRGTLVALLSTLSLGVLAAEGASAHTWTKNGVPITKSTAVKGKATLTFNMRGQGETFECSTVQKATVNGAKGEITSITGATGKNAIECKQTLNSGKLVCSSTAKVELEAGDLPWDTELVTGSGGELRDIIRSGGKGVPEWHLKCETTTTFCVYEPGTSTRVAGFSGGVEAWFDEKSERGNCTLGGAGTLEAKGTEIITLEGESTLGAS
jgi:hypothetical protein